MSLQVSSFNSSMMQHNGIVQEAIVQQNEFFHSVNSTSEMRYIIDYSVDCNRLYERTDGSIGLSEKPIGHVIGEQIIAPAIESVNSLTKNMFWYLGKGFGYLRNSLSSIYNFQILPGASAQEAPYEWGTVKKKLSINQESLVHLPQQLSFHFLVVMGPWASVQ